MEAKNSRESSQLFVFPNFAPHFTDFSELRGDDTFLCPIISHRFVPVELPFSLRGSDGAERNSGDTNFSLPGGGDHGAGGGVRCLGATAKTRPGGDGQREEAGRKQMAGSHIHTCS